MEYAASHLYFLGIHTSLKQQGQQNQWDMRAAHDGKVGCNNVEYTTALLYSDWLYFLRHGIQKIIQ